jgi:hypothetical protein
VLLGDVIVKDSAENELIQPIAALGKVVFKALRSARDEFRELLNHKGVECIM